MHFVQYRPQDVVEPLESIRNTVKFINWLILSRASPRGTLEPERSPEQRIVPIHKTESRNIARYIFRSNRIYRSNLSVYLESIDL